MEAKLKKEWRKLIDIRHREIKEKLNDPKRAVLNTYEYEASWWKEYFMTFEDKEDRTIFSLLRLRFPGKTIIPELEWSSIIREIHTFWDQLNIWEKGSTFGQHVWFWKRLIAEAEKVAIENWYKRMAVIAWVWVRPYYEKRWYKLDWEYMVKDL